MNYSQLLKILQKTDVSNNSIPQVLMSPIKPEAERHHEPIIVEDSTLVNVYTCTGGGIFHTMNNLNSVLYAMESRRKIKFHLVIHEDGAFGSVFKDFFRCKNPKNVKKITYVARNGQLSELIKKNSVRILPNDLNPGSKHYMIRGKSTGNFFFKVERSVVAEIRKKTHFINFSQTIGVHFRNTDYRSNFDKIIEQVKKINNKKDIFLATDDYHAIQKFKKHLGKSLIHLANIEPIGQFRNFHCFRGEVDQHSKLLDCLTDIYVLVNAKSCIFSSGSWKKFIPKIKRTKLLF